MNKIEEFLNSWTDGVVEIGRVFLDMGDYESCAERFLSSHYAFDTEDVLFKPTFTKEVIFRNTKESALSYFVKGYISEDKGFALKPWKEITLKELNKIQKDGLIVLMGALNFIPVGSDEVTIVAFTFLLTEVDGLLKIKAHHSSPVL